MITAIDQKTALVLIDLQKGIVGYPLAHPTKEVLDNAAKLIEAFRKAGKPVVFVNVIPSGSWTKTRKDAPTASGNFPADFSDIAPELNPQPKDIYVTKRTWGAFYETALHSELSNRGITNIVIGGISTSKGVEGTARQAAELGYNLSFVTDAMTDRVLEAHNASITYTFPGMGEVGVTADVIGLL